MGPPASLAPASCETAASPASAVFAGTPPAPAETPPPVPAETPPVPMAPPVPIGTVLPAAPPEPVTVAVTEAPPDPPLPPVERPSVLSPCVSDPHPITAAAMTSPTETNSVMDDRLFIVRLCKKASAKPNRCTSVEGWLRLDHFVPGDARSPVASACLGQGPCPCIVNEQRCAVASQVAPSPVHQQSALA